MKHILCLTSVDYRSEYFMWILCNLAIIYTSSEVLSYKLHSMMCRRRQSTKRKFNWIFVCCWIILRSRDRERERIRWEFSNLGLFPMLSNRELSYHDTLSNIKKNQITVRRCSYATEQREFTNVKSNAQNIEERSYRNGTLLFPFFAFFFLFCFALSALHTQCGETLQCDLIRGTAHD